jgi:hypothetical protein
MFTIIAVLFIGSTVHVAYDASATNVVETFSVPNNEIGANELQSKLAPILSQVQGKPMVCMGAAEGYSLKGAAFEEVVFNEEVRRFMLAQPRYLLDAKALGLSSQDPKALLRACQSVFPAKRS